MKLERSDTRTSLALEADVGAEVMAGLDTAIGGAHGRGHDHDRDHGLTIVIATTALAIATADLAVGMRLAASPCLQVPIARSARHHRNRDLRTRSEAVSTRLVLASHPSPRATVECPRLTLCWRPRRS